MLRIRVFGVAGALALASGALIVPAAPAVTAAVSVQPMTVTPRPSLGTFNCQTHTCFTPAQMQAAYDEQPLLSKGITGKGETIVLVDAFGSPTIKSDLASFDTHFGLPAPPKFSIIRPDGAVPKNTTWAFETTIDVEWAHAMAPGANILLAETPVAETEGVTGFPQIVEAENYVIDHHLGDVISQSFGAAEQTFPSKGALLKLRSAYVNAAQQGVTVLGATGDAGATSFQSDGTSYFPKAVVNWPASDPLVTAVGGTQVRLNGAGQRTAPDRVWNDTFNTALEQAIFGSPGPIPWAATGGKSVVFPRPPYQDGVAGVTGSQRGVPDVTLNAACSSPVYVYESPAGLQPACGTSLASPLFAGIVALADQMAGHSLGLLNPALYAMSANHDAGLVDVTRGNNTVAYLKGKKTTTVQGYTAVKGYDLASGLGTINAALFVPELVQTADRQG